MILLSAEEQQRVKVEWGETATLGRKERCVSTEEGFLMALNVAIVNVM